MNKDFTDYLEEFIEAKLYLDEVNKYSHTTIQMYDSAKENFNQSAKYLLRSLKETVEELVKEEFRSCVNDTYNNKL